MTGQTEGEPGPGSGDRGGTMAKGPVSGQGRSFTGVLVLVSAAFLALLTPLFGPVLWAVAVTLLFFPWHRSASRRLGLSANAGATLSLVMIVLTAVVPALLVGALLTAEASAQLGQVSGAGLEMTVIAERLRSLQPAWLERLLGPDSLADPHQAEAWVSGTLTSALRGLIARAPGIGQTAFGYLIDLAVMLYLSFFLLRDGARLATSVEAALPLAPEFRRVLMTELGAVVRATLKSSLVIAVLQGTIGGIVFALLGLRAPVLWGTAMGFMSLLPAVGTGIIWVPVALYLLFTGAVWQGLALAFCGLFVIGTVDNLVRPILIGRTSHIPNVVVFLATIGALSLFGVNGIIVGPLIACLFTVTWRIRNAALAAGHDRPDRQPPLPPPEITR